MKTCFGPIALTVLIVLIAMSCLRPIMAQGNSIDVSPTSLSFCVAANNSSAPPAQVLTVGTSNPSGVAFNANAFPSWVRLNGSTSTIVGNTVSSPTISVTIDPSAYSSGGPQSGTIQINAGNSLTVPVMVSVTPTCTYLPAASPTSVNFTSTQMSQAVTISGATGASITATPVYGNTNPSGWFSLSTTSLQAGQASTVTLVASNLPSGTNGSILFTQDGTSNSVSVPVIYTTGGTATGLYTATPSSLTPTFANPQAASQSQMVMIGGPGAPLTSTVNLGNGPSGWITATQPAGPAPTSIQVTVNPANLPTGTTTGSVIVTQNGASNSVTIPVTASMTNGLFNYSPNPFTFVVPGGSSIQEDHVLTITGPDQAQVVATTRIFSGTGQWLTFSDNTNDFGTLTNSSLALVITVNPSSLPANQTYSGAIVITQNGTLVLTVPVTVTTLPFTQPRDFTGSGLSGALLYDPVLGTAYTAMSNRNGQYQYVYNLFSPAFDTLRTGDFNADGKTDVVVYNSLTALAYIGLSNGDGTFTFQSLFWSPGYNFVEPGDLNADGKTDFVLYNSNTGTLYTAISNGAGGFTYKYTLVSPGFTYVRLADFSANAKGGLLLYNATNGLAYLGVGDGAGGFAFQPLFMSPGYDLLDIADLNRDGRADLVAYNSNNGNAATGIGDGMGGFAFTPLLFSPGFTSVRMADYTGDGYADVTLYNKNTASAYFGIGSGHGTFTFHSLFWSLGYDYVISQDVNADNMTDVVLYNSATGTEYTGISNGDGTFTYFYQYWGIGRVLAK